MSKINVMQVKKDKRDEQRSLKHMMDVDRLVDELVWDNSNKHLYTSTMSWILLLEDLQVRRWWL